MCSRGVSLTPRCKCCSIELESPSPGVSNTSKRAMERLMLPKAIMRLQKLFVNVSSNNRGSTSRLVNSNSTPQGRLCDVFTDFGLLHQSTYHDFSNIKHRQNPTKQVPHKVNRQNVYLRCQSLFNRAPRKSTSLLNCTR